MKPWVIVELFLWPILGGGGVIILHLALDNIAGNIHPGLEWFCILLYAVILHEYWGTVGPWAGKLQYIVQSGKSLSAVTVH